MEKKCHHFHSRVTIVTVRASVFDCIHLPSWRRGHTSGYKEGQIITGKISARVCATTKMNSGHSGDSHETVKTPLQYMFCVTRKKVLLNNLSLFDDYNAIISFDDYYFITVGYSDTHVLYDIARFPRICFDGLLCMLRSSHAERPKHWVSNPRKRK